MEKTLNRESMELSVGDKWFQVTVDPILDEKGSLCRTVHIIRDCTQQKLTELESVKVADRFRAMIDTAPYGAHLYELATDGKLIFIGANSSADTILQVKNEQFIGKTIEEAFPNLVGTEIPDAYRNVALSGKSFNTEQITYSDDRGIVGAFEVCAFQTAPNKIAALFRDITEKKKSEEALRRSREEVFKERERIAVTLSSIGDGVITTDTDARILFLNPVAEAITGFHAAEAIGRPLADVFHIVNETTRKPCESPVEKVLKTGAIQELANHTLLLSRDGREILLADSGSPIKDERGNVFGVVLVFSDVTEKRKMQDTLQQTQKLDALGILAGGIAHDFNNLLGGIFGFIDLALLSRSIDKITTEYLDNAMRALGRARSLTRQLLTFSKGGAPMRKSGSLERVVKESALFALSGSNMTCRFTFDAGLRACEFDENQISQVIDNLVLNAQQATPMGGAIDVSVKNVRESAGGPHALAEGDYIMITVKDYGIGIPLDIMPRIFDPFFTTKQRGHGLGLATAYSIVRKHEGSIEAESVQGKGATFRIFLPASPQTPASVPREPQGTYTGSGRILIMDDEDFIRDTVSAMLRSLGHEPVCVKNSEEAIAVLAQEKATGLAFVLIILDLTIPGGIGGKDVLARIRAIDETVPVVVASGYSEDQVMATPKDFGFTGSISKPFTVKEINALLSSLFKKEGNH
jgi:PAS domain S-box-containing protein